MIERDVTVLILLVDQHRMALRERAALGILAGDAHAMALEQKRAERERLRRGPVDVLARLDRLAAIFQKALDGPVGVKAFRYLRDARPDLPQGCQRRAGMTAARVVRIASRLDVGPTAVEPVGAVGLVALARLKLGVELGAPLKPHLLDLALADDVLADELLGVDIGRGR